MAAHLPSADASLVQGESMRSSTLAPSDYETSTISSHHDYEPIPTATIDAKYPEVEDVPESTQNVPKISEDHPHRFQDLGLLKRNRFHWSVILPLDVLLAIGPIFFFIIASMCLSLQNKTKSVYGEDIKSITLVAPSIFPILYAAILGKMLRRVGLYKSERNARIGTVERLVGCQSVFTAVERQIALRRFDLLGCSILVAWLLSPLGGQSSLRMLSTQPSTKEFTNTIRYFPIEGFARQTFLFGGGRGDLSWTLWAPLYMTALQTSRQYWSSPMDLFGNVRIPDIRQLSPSIMDIPNYDWHNFSDVKSVNYSSMLGLPLVGLPEMGNSTLSLQSFYWPVDCGEWNSEDFESIEYTQTPSFNMTLNRWTAVPERLPFLYKSRRVTNQTISDVYNPHANISGKIYTSACYALPFVVESDVTCQGRSCSVQGMRKLPRDYHYVLSWFDVPIDFIGLIWSQMPGADIGYNGEVTTRSSELVEQWIADPQLAQFDWVLRGTTEWKADQRWVNLATLTPAEFSRRLQIAMNTYWDASVGSTIRMGNLTFEQVENMSVGNFHWNTTELKGRKFDGEQYVCNIVLAAFTMGISFALFVAAVVSLVLGAIIKAPDILGFVSTAARDSPYVAERVSSRSDGLEAARTLRDVRMRIGDVNEDGEVGHVALTTITDTDHKRLSRKRLYD